MKSLRLWDDSGISSFKNNGVSVNKVIDLSLNLCFSDIRIGQIRFLIKIPHFNLSKIWALQNFLFLQNPFDQGLKEMADPNYPHRRRIYFLVNNRGRIVAMFPTSTAIYIRLHTSILDEFGTSLPPSSTGDCVFSCFP